ncbi:hypothetical protein KIH39_20465 [Telmatocola sphagniphila]|uniref:Lipoprotein n=1 Tax=Telmatocola sphagniphila TaxID=1123043 RepID=A0A8E6B3D9_9BACT|nr:hypothetical protein [Telmatocola sphagniphila]QVL31198.1 hypothetical protein KIH39_20465 [Telmatocola sphagniphila]
MKKRSLSWLARGAVGLVVLTGCNSESKPHDAAPKEAAAKPPAGVKPGAASPQSKAPAINAPPKS